MRAMAPWCLALFAFTAFGTAAVAGPIQFQASGLGAAGFQFDFALDFIDGDGPSNQVFGNSFVSDGGLALKAQTGAVSGSLAGGLLFNDSAFFNEALLALSGATTFGFVFDPSANPPAAGGFPDAFSVFLLDAITGQSLVQTDDPTGANALLLYVIDGSGTGQLQVFDEVSTLGVSWSASDAGVIPEPSPFALIVVTLGVLAVLSARRPLLARRPWRARGGAAAAALVLALGTAQAEDLTSSVQVVRSGFVLNRVTGTFDAQVTVTNQAGDTLLGPLKLALESATPANVALYNSYGRLPSGADYVVLPLPAGTLAPGESAVGIVRLLNYGQAVAATTFSVQGERLTAANSAQIEASGVFPAGVLGPDETPVGAGFVVKVDGVVRGTTDAAGKLLVTVPVGAQIISMERAPSEGGSATLPALVAGATLPVTIEVDEGKEIGAASRLRFDQVQQGVLARSATRISLRFLKDEQPVRLTTLSSVNLTDIVGNYTNLSALFSLQADGSVAAIPSAFFQALAGKSGALTLEVSGEDAAGAVNVGTAKVYLADYRVRVQLVAPPSNPGLPLAGIRLTATLLNTELRFSAQSNANGYVVLPDLPAGNLSLNGASTAAGIVYTGLGTAAINKNSLVNLTMRGPQDVLNNVSPISVVPLPPGALSAALGGVPAPGVPPRRFFSPREAAERARLHAEQAARGGAVPPSMLAASSAPSVTVSATGAGQNVLVQNSAELAIKKGTKKATLRYTVFTAEYPTYVLQQSIYNDVWSVSVFGGNGAMLFEITRQINSQLFQEPVWQTNGSTGEIKTDIDVAALAASADTSLIVRATSVNIGDGVLPTTATATLEASEALLIGTITPSAMPAGTNNDGTFYSIPRPAATNVLQRTFALELTKPSGSTLTGVTVELRSGAGASLMKVLDDVAPGTPDVVVESESDTAASLRVRATITSPASTVASVPPPTRDLAYRFTVKANDTDGAEISDEKDASGKRGLWRMPDGLGRFGTRDAGGDDWAARGGYNWLVNNSALLREINDVSGEHGRNLGHETHARGTDIDMYHFYRFPGAVSGGQNYTLLQNDLVLAFQTLQPAPPAAATAAFGRVSNWVTQTRQGLTALAALPSVSRLIYCSGTAAQGLAAGWCSTLLQTGNATRTVSTPAGPQTETLAFGGTFANAKMTYRNDHNDHVHITLNPAQIGE